MLKPEDIAAYLKQNPSFFETHQDVISELGKDELLPPFHARQLAVLKQRYNNEKAKYDMVVDSARNNQALEQALHDFAQKLLASKNSSQETIENIVKEQFDLKHSRIFLFAYDKNESQIPAGIDQELLNQRVAHGSSICDDRVSKSQLSALFGADQEVGSCAFIPLQASELRDKNIGVMILGADDPTRFTPGMGSVYLDRIGQLIAALLSPTSPTT